MRCAVLPVFLVKLPEVVHSIFNNGRYLAEHTIILALNVKNQRFGLQLPSSVIRPWHLTQHQS